MRNTTFCCIVVSLYVFALQMASESVSVSKASIEELNPVNVQYIAGDPTPPPPQIPPPPIVDIAPAS